jgi:hypothetical protein
MLALDLFNTPFERALNEGAVDDLEARRIHHLNTRMLELMSRANDADFKASPKGLAGLKREYQKLKDERDGYYKIREAGIPGSVPVEKIPGKEDLLKGKGRSYYEATGDDKFDSMMNRIGKDPWTQLNSDPNWEYEIEELVDQQIEPWLLAMEKGGMPITRDEETLNPDWRKRYEQVANKLAQEFLTSRGLNPRDPDLVGKIRYAIDWHTDESKNVHGQLSAYSDLPMQRYAGAFDTDGMTANIRDALAGLRPGDDDDDDDDGYAPRPDADPRKLDPGNMEEDEEQDIAKVKKWDPITGGDFPTDYNAPDIATAIGANNAEKHQAMMDYYANNIYVTKALEDLYRATQGGGYHDSVSGPERYLGTIENQRTGKTEKRYFKSKADAYRYAKGYNAVLVNLEKINNQEDTSDLITLPVMLGVKDHKKKWMLQFPSEQYAQKWEFQHKNVAKILWTGEHALAEDAQDEKSWMTQTRDKYPDAKFMQAKMPGAPIRAYVNGKVVAEFNTDQKKNSALGEKKLGQLRPTLGTGRDVGRSVKKFRAQRGLDEKSTGPLDQKLQRLKVQARRQFPRAHTDDEALLLKLLDKETQDDQANRRTDARQDAELKQNFALDREQDDDIDNLQAQASVKEHGGGIGPRQRWQDLMQERKLSVGDPVVVTAPNEFEGKTGEIYNFAPSGKFVIVDLYNHGKHSMHLSDVEYNQYADDQEQDDWYDEGMAETVTDPRAGMARIYRRLAPKIERYRDSFLAGQLYDELENYAELHGAESEFKRMLNGARNRAHMEYDTNPGGFHNWFWFLPFADESGVSEMDKSQKSPSRHGDYPLGAKGTTAKPVAARKVVKDLAMDLDQAFAKQKPVKKKGVAESAKPGEYYIHTVYFKDGTKKRIRVTSDEFDVVGYYTKRGQAVDRVDYDFQLHSDMTEGLKSTLAGAALAGAMALGGAGAAQAQSASSGLPNATTIIQQIQAGKIQNQNDLSAALGDNQSIRRFVFKQLQAKAGLPGHGADSVINALGGKSTAGAQQPNAGVQQPTKSTGQSGVIIQRPTDNFEGKIKEDQDTSGVERAILNRIMVAHTDLLMKFGPDKVMQAAEEVAYNVGDVDEIGTSDVSAYVAQVKQILGATP